MQPLRVLLVDDHARFLELAGTFLAKLPELQIVGQSQSGNEALEMVGRLSPDLVLVDLFMPGMNGVEVARQLKSLSKAPYVVMMSFHNQAEYRALVNNIEVDGFISKINFVKELTDIINQLQNGLLPEKLSQTQWEALKISEADVP